MRAVSRYLTASIRAGAYAANLHLLSLIDSSLDRSISNALVRRLVYAVYGVLLYEIAARIVRARYKPKFVRAGDGRTPPSALPVLDDRDYQYRVTAEKLIYESGLFYGFSLLVGVALCSIITVEGGWEKVGLGVLGAIVSFFNFWGVVMISCAASPSNSNRMSLIALGCGLMAPLVVYVLLTLRYLVLG
jgi:hypothetical protein